MNGTSVDDDIKDNILTNLKLLSMLEINQKLNIRKGHLHIDNNNKLQCIKRWLHNDDRYQSIAFIKNLIKNINLVIQLDPSLKNRVIDEIIPVETGIKNLKTTYSSDPVVIVMLDNILTKLKDIC